jgi:hypothetical protein
MKQKVARLDDPKQNHKSRLRAWFRRLSVDERVSALAIENQATVALVRQMFVCTRRIGAGLFFVNSEDVSTTEFRDYCFRKFDLISQFIFMPEMFLANDRRLEDAVRLCDTREYLDTLVRVQQLALLRLTWNATDAFARVAQQ